MDKLITVSKALCRVGRRSVLAIDHFELAVGQHWCVFGPNGAGKTLLANLITARRRDSGSYVHYAKGFDAKLDIHAVSFEEQQRLVAQDNRVDISEYNENAQDIGTTVRALICSSRAREDQDPDLLNTLTEQLHLEPFLGQGIRFLSSGQTRKVLIARALYARRHGATKLLVFDDPLESIDVDSQAGVSRCIESQLGSQCSSLQLCRRDQDIMASATHMALMNELRVLEQGELAAVTQGANFLALRNRAPVLPTQIPSPVYRSTSPEDSSGLLIELKEVSASYGDKEVFSGFSWSMSSADHVLIAGPNGCGKSTLLSLIDGENHKAYGQKVSLFGRLRGSGETVWDVKSRFGLVSNELHNKYIRGWKVLDVVVSGYFDSVGLYDDSGTAEIEKARQWLNTLGVAALDKSYYHEISFGQQRLVLLARAMVKHPRVLILDEPCVGLDDFHRALILGTLDVIADQAHTNLIYVSHVAGEKPACITQKLEFTAAAQGKFRLEASPL